jgi:tRNA(fMet)-specific endonuclease VapC
LGDPLPQRPAGRRLKTPRIPKKGVGISLVSLAELYEGVYYSRDPETEERDLNDFLRGVSVIGIDDETCKRFGKERGRLRAKKKMIGDFDLLIGAIALPRFNFADEQPPPL